MVLVVPDSTTSQGVKWQDYCLAHDGQSLKGKQDSFKLDYRQVDDGQSLKGKQDSFKLDYRQVDDGQSLKGKQDSFKSTS